MPVRTIKAVYFQYRTEKGTYVTARRGATVDIPEGRYLDRGDQLGMFVGETSVEEALANEAAGIVTPTEPVTPVPSIPVDLTAGVSAAVVPTPEPGPEVVAPGNESGRAPITTETEGDLVTTDSTVDAILEYVGTHPDEAPAFLAAENDKPKPRVSLVEGLNKIIEG